ncbi:deoxynucleoside triphosphate triphosphohydrolase SAMHD1-like isoform X2 [Ruditapes philippinarum]|uniref:deoxynucleoside triphosphate triphosphohydrolase SAMHD1-like isoform X2 n=1 Tax=Ruditapes philippinarum TaxID=129788 RepID=UPI00295A6611|nr:deoxynucleoside triphosphate triphosphohydrolase SAMHD1-like isoform X2 [Ruditapes philippinarum]
MESLTEQSAPDAEAIASANNIFLKGKTFNDPFHGQVKVHPVCVRIIDTPQFQRLRHIKQLDTCYLVYPGASHNRFEHSIGVCYLAGKLLKTIGDRQPGEEISDKDILCVEIAGLCHDLGQGPFSHVFEKRFMPKMKKKFTHENIARTMFEYMLSSENGQLKKDIQEILTGCGLSRFDEQDFTFICEMIDDPKDIEKREWPYKSRNKDKSYMYEIVANKRNGIDVDKWDYIARDSYMLGMKFNVDYNRCFTNARVIKCNGINGRQDSSNTGNGQVYRKQICYRDKVAQDLYDMFYTRMTLHRRAYQHKTHKIIGMMICDALELADAHFTIHGKRISETVDDMEAYTYLNDDVIQLIINDNNPKLDAAREILLDIMYRRLLKCVTQTHCKDKNLTEIDLKEGIWGYLKGTGVKEMSLHYDIVKFNYGMEDKNPLEKVRFYTKDYLDEPIKLAKNQVSYVLPDVFEECIIRLYCKMEDPSQETIVKRVTKAFAEWCKEKNYPPPQEVSSSQTTPKQLAESSEGASDDSRETHRQDGTSEVQTTKSFPEPAQSVTSKQPSLSYLDIRPHK